MRNYCISDYPWHTLSSPIVDVGAGIGTLEMSILEDARNSHLEFVLFDIPDTMENAQKVIYFVISCTFTALKFTLVPL
jgi:hypothetical protein